MSRHNQDMIIDAHTHLFMPDVARDREKFFTDVGFAALYRKPGSKIITEVELLSAMDAGSIDRSVVMGFAWERQEFIERQNRYFSELPGKTGHRLLPFGTVHVNDAEGVDSIADQVSAIKKEGLFGIGEVAFYRGEGGGFFRVMDALLGAAVREKLPVCLHVNEPVGHHYPGKYGTDFAELYRLIEKHPVADIVLAHWGGGVLFYELMPEVRKAFQRVRYDTAASPLLYEKGIYEVAAGILGSEKILFGSDYPLINGNRYITPIESSPLSASEKKDILGGNAQRMLGLS